ncbi:type IV pilus assembly protein PilY1 [Halospina denitrificans]|uniref:Type IV pilus assembly protein PilY1 n=1 Tax=Halospina denitrificans TaxID=332522 RepID=A0A4R7JHM8_9GAMM|nr:PilC/PilY family type IV pilus protein [Halospina denitrificans]TDT37125.1 type IV pilus assembly protein PilY1 [Halospina denitrificans]
MKAHKNFRFGSFALMATMFVSQALAETVDISDTPLFISESASPNLMFLLDDSGSMRFSFMPGKLAFEKADILLDTDNEGYLQKCPSKGTHAGIKTCFYDTSGRKFLASSETNKVYYDPSKEYAAPLKADGEPYPDVDFSSAPVDGFAAADGDDSTDPATVDLADDYRAIMAPFYFKAKNDNHYGFTVGSTTGGDSEEGAFYYEFDGTVSGCDTDPYDDSCYSAKKEPADKQNFANWFSYYRTRELVARVGITNAFMDQPENMRVGYETINSSDIDPGVRQFSDSVRTAFFDWLHGHQAGGSTPLRDALDRVGQYYEDDTDQGPWATDPGTDDDEKVGEFLECRQSFTILMSDGYYNGGSPPTPGNTDGTDGSTITQPDGGSYQYTAQDPFQDEQSDTLADVGMDYWRRDLQPDIKNRVPVSDTNPAFWQHMVTYSVGLGVEGSIDPDTAFNAIDNGDSVDWWPDSASAQEHKIDDMLHAAVNSRGGFFDAQSPDAFTAGLKGTLAGILEDIGSSTGVTFDTATLEEDSLIFGARFNSSRWSGDLDARELITDDNNPDQPPTISDPVWSAADMLDDRDWTTREIITSDGTLGVPFTWSAVTQDHQDDLLAGPVSETRAKNRLDYLRGDRSLEGGEVGDFRARDSRLGDIVNSTPVRVSEPASNWPDTALFGEDKNRYSDFRAEKKDRTPVIYAGANDGMLHAFKATPDGGKELFAFMPEAIFSDAPGEGLRQLTLQQYTHDYYVDLKPHVSDAFIKGRTADGSITTSADWRTVLLGGARFGGRSIFALDVTDPTLFDEDNAEQLVLWEFSAEDDWRMGNISEPPIIAKADWGNDGYQWTAFFGNGYNATDPDTGEAITGIFMLKLEGGLDGTWTEGTDYEFIEFESGTAATGLSPVNVYDATGNGIVDRIYGGDLKGQLWVAEGFASAYTSGNTPVPLFRAKTDAGDPQAITAAPLTIPNNNIAPDGNEPDLFVLFGTGQYLNNTDLTDTSTDSFYAVRDIGSKDVELERADLEERNLVNDTTVDGETLVSNNADSTDTTIDNGWYVDLFSEGERITLSPQVRGDFIFVNSSIPSSNPCIAGGTSRIMAFALDGLTPDKAVFDNHDGEVVSYRRVDGIASQSAFLGDYRFTPTSVGDVDVEKVLVQPPEDVFGRQGWQELLE